MATFICQGIDESCKDDCKISKDHMQEFRQITRQTLVTICLAEAVPTNVANTYI
jgi:hypothetical protein